jgi:hypothetical protein
MIEVMDFPKPDFVEIKMDAEIGSYQESEEPREPEFVQKDETESSRD